MISMKMPGEGVVFFGELLMRIGTKRFERFTQARDWETGFTGSEANAAVSLANLGGKAHLLSAVPNHDLGQACINYFRQFGIDTDHVQRCGSRLGVFYLETGVSNRSAKVIYDRSSSAFSELRLGQVPWAEVLAGKKWLHWSGTAPALGKNMAALVGEGCVAAKQAGLTVSCDLNFRKKLWNTEQARAVMPALMQNVDVLISGREDAASMLGLEMVDEAGEELEAVVDYYRRVATELHRRFGFSHIATTLRQTHSASDNSLTAILSNGSEVAVSRTERIWMVDRVGGGDAFAGALIHALIQQMPLKGAVEFALVASCLKHSIHGDVNHVTVAEVQAVMESDVSGRIQR